jgi:triphosphatase
MEVELKFQIPAPNREALRKAVATASAQTTRLQAVYVDTADQRLAQAGLALRLRKEGRVWVQTLKGRGDGLAQRLEHEVPLGAKAGVPSFDLSLHDGSAVGALLRRASANAGPLLPVYRTDIQRLHRRIRSKGAVIELAYDCGFIVAGTKKLAVQEIEFELISGPAVALPALAARWVQRHGLWWEVRTKSERGFRLALDPAAVPAVPAVNWKRAKDPLHAALLHVLPNAAELASGSGGPEHLHQLLAGMRRLQTLGFQTQSPLVWVPAQAPQTVRGAAFNLLLLRALGQVLGAASAHPQAGH